MARDPQAALMALNRFGFGARGGASGDWGGAASDPRGFVKADLHRPNNARLEMPGLQPTPALAQAVFAYQAEVKAAREAAKANPAAEMAAAETPAAMETPDKPSENKPVEAKSMDNQPMEKSAEKLAEKTEVNAPMQASEAAAPAKPLNVIQKTFRAEALARLQRALMVDCGFTERLVTFWSNHFCISAAKGELARIWAGAFEREAILPH